MNLPSKSAAKRSLVAGIDAQLPALILDAGSRGQKRFVEFFTANIRNPNTRQAYFRACTRFLEWCEGVGLELRELQPVHVAGYIEILLDQYSAPTVKQHLSAIGQLFNYLVIGQVMEVNPASGVRSPKHVVEQGKTPIMDTEQVRALLGTIKGERPIDYRDRALVGTMLYTFARVSAAANLKVKDYLVHGAKAYLRLHEKGGKRKEIPVHHELRDLLEQYLVAAGIADDGNGYLFRSAGPGRSKKGLLTERPISRYNILHLVKKYARRAGLSPELCNHSFRGTGITNFLENGGDLDDAAYIANHASTRTTKLYDRRRQEVSQGEIERIRF